MENEETRQQVISEISKLVEELHPELHEQPVVTMDSRLDKELGLDSISRMELLVRLEKKLQLHVADTVMTTAETPRDILRALESAGARRETVQGQQRSFMPESAQERRAYGAARTINEVIAHHAEALGDTVHICLEDFSGEPSFLSFDELYAGAVEMAAGLQQYTLEPGDTVALMLPTSMDYFRSFLAILLAGCVPVPLYPPTRPSQIEEHLRRHTRILANAQAKILITLQEVRPVSRLLQTQLTTLHTVVIPDELKGRGRSFVPIPCHARDTAFLQYTSGSTGDPKGVILSHANLLANIRAMGKVTEAGPEDVFVSWLPLYHDMGLIGAWLGSLYYGCRLVVMSPLAFLARPERWLWAIHRHRGTLSASPNFGYELCCRRVEESAVKGLDLRSWRLAFNGAEPISSHTMFSFIERYTPYGFRREAYAPVYGLAESSVGLAFPPINRGPVVDYIDRDLFLRAGEASPVEQQEGALEFVACGRPLPGHQIRIVDTDGRELPERHQGRLHFKGPSTTSGYLRSPEQTRRLFVDGWLDSGDLAYVADGDVYITSRVKDIIIRGGRNVYPHEYEEAVGDVDGIRKGCVAVFGSHDQRDGTERVVVVAESRVTEEKRKQALSERITAIGVDLLSMPPDDIVIAPPGTVLKTSSGKVRRSATREIYEKGLIGRQARAVWLQLVRMWFRGTPAFARRFLQRVGNHSYAVYCWVAGVLTALIVGGLMRVVPGKNACWRIAHHGARMLALATGTRILVEGQEYIDESEHIVCVANHMSYLDALVLTAVMPFPCSYVAKAELANRWMRGPLERLETIFVERFDAEQGKEDSRRITRLVAGGKRVLFFAEGTLQRMPGLLPFQMGAFTAAVENGVGIVPITIKGTRSKLRAESWFPRRGPVRVIFSKKIMPEGTEWQAALGLRTRVRETILRQVGEPDLAGEYSSLGQLGLGPNPAKEKSGATSADQ